MSLGWQKLVMTVMVAVLGAATVMQTVSAQSNAPPTPGSVIAPVDRPVIQPKSAPAKLLQNADDGGFKPPASSAKIEIKQFQLSGNTLFGDDELLAVIRDYIDTLITLEQLYQAADELQRFYRQQGYPLASVYVPAQKVSSGTVRLEIIEGRIAGVQIEGELDSYQPAFLLRHFGTDNLGEVISQARLEEQILLLNELPGLSAKAVIVPGAEYGTSDIVIQVEEDRSSVVLRVNNYGRESLGETRVEAGWLYVNLIAQGDQLNLSAIVAEESRMNFLRADYDALLNSLGTRIGASISAFEYDVDTDAIDLRGELDGDGTNLRFFVNHPLLRRQRNRLDFTAALRFNETSEDGDLAFTTDTTEVELLDLSLHWQPAHRNGSFSSLSATFTSNFEDNPDGLKDDAVKAKISMYYSFIMPFAGTWFWQLGGDLVYSDEPLPDIERYRLGGPRNVRAYPATEIAGDRGGRGSLDLGKRFSLSAKTSMITRLFVDAGKVERILTFAGENSTETLSGYGAGLLFDFGNRHALDFEVATPTSDLESSDGKNTRFWLNYTVEL
jgi:hemolysin activation/secretion protein